ncbi:uncharacterized protein LOC111366797 [Olea europaea var. sylvestris]|uniref:uncharacterized protein LOC111366797 n=1 Tax=Olea europaea var. sylvestris TaxID=158386 RepID=UPI000C1CFE14|nr:uncharacterized protein LOC111366797 [Olea europaea var. sylvestris]
MQRWFYERKSVSTKCSTTVTPKIDDKLRKSFDAGATLPVRNLDELVFELGIVTELCTIDLIGNTCSCRVFQIQQIPCSHASRAACAKEKSLYDLCSPYHTTKYWRAVYNEVLHPVGQELDWVVPRSIRSVEVLSPNIRRAPRGPGRRESGRERQDEYHSDEDDFDENDIDMGRATHRGDRMER